MAQLVCLILSVIFAALSAANIPQPPRLHYLSVAVALLALAFIVGNLGANWR